MTDDPRAFAPGSVRLGEILFTGE